MPISLREITVTDLPWINHWRNDAELVTAMGTNFQFVAPMVDERWFQHYLANRHAAIRLAIDALPPDNNASAQPIGMVYLTDIHPINRTAELSAFIGDRSYRKQGVAYTACRLILRHGFQHINLNRVVANVLAHNHASLALCRKLGFKHEGTQRQAVFLQGRYADLEMFSLLATEFDSNVV